MKNLLEKKLKKKTNTRYEFGQLSATGSNVTETTGTDPTNTTITVLTTVSNIFNGDHRRNIN